MKTLGFRDTAVRLRDQNGIALPLALLGLVLVSVLVTGALITSSTEAAIGGAHRDAVESIYTGEGAIHAYLSDLAEAGEDIRPGTVHGWRYSHSSGADRPYDFDVGKLSLRRQTTPVEVGEDDQILNPPRVHQTEVFSITSRFAGEGGRGTGRSVGSLIEAVKSWTFVNFDVEGGATVGGALRVRGGARISAYSELCEDSTGAAIRHTTNVDREQIDADPSQVTGGIEQYENVHRNELIQHVLGGVSFDDLAREAEIVFNKDNPFRSSEQIYAKDRDQTHRYNWGCPDAIGANCGSDAQKAAEARDYHPIVYIEAPGATGSERPHIQTEYGQGVLLVRGNVRISAQFLFQGILIVDGGVTITGGGGQSSDGSHRIEGALVATGGVEDERDEDVEFAGSAVVRLNQCALQELQEHLEEGGGRNIPHSFERGPFGWFEVVR